MKTAYIFGAALAAQAATIDTSGAIEKRQTGLAITSGLMSFITGTSGKTAKAAVNTRTLKASIFPAAQRRQIIWGPFTLKPAGGQHVQQGLKLDKQSDVIEEAISGLCTDCMVLQARAEITDKEGKRLDLKSEVYTHHIIVANLGRMMVMPALIPGGLGGGSCAGGAKSTGGMGGMMGMSSPKPAGGNGMPPKMDGHSHSRRQATSGGGLSGLLGGLLGGGSSGSGGSSGPSSLSNPWSIFSGVRGFSIFIGKGNEGDSSVFAPVNSTSLKSGYWLGKGDKITATAEVVNYKSIPQDVYLSIDAEYLQMNGTRPSEYLDVGFGAMQIEQCGDLYLKPAKDKMTTFSSAEHSVSSKGYLINMSPHLHDGALNMKILVNDKLVCQSDAVYGEDGGTKVNGQSWETITSYTPCLEPVPIKPGDKVKMTSDYDLTKHKLRPDSKEAGAEAEAMAIGNYFFAQAR